MPERKPIVKIIATDLDGTLFYPKKRIRMIPRKTASFLKRFVADGGRVVLVSSRGDNFPPRIAKHLDCPFDFIGVDGGLIIIDGEVKFRRFFDPEKLKEVIFYVKQFHPPMLYMLTTREKPLILTRSAVKKVVSTIYSIYMFVQGAYKEYAIRSDHVFFSEIAKGEAYKLMLFVGYTKKAKLSAKRLAEELNEKFDFLEAHWLNEVVEVTPKGCNKADGVAKYLDYLGVSHDNIAVVGDGGNDVPMLERFHEHSFAMEHAHRSIKMHANKTIRRFADLEEELYPSADSQSAK